MVQIRHINTPNPQLSKRWQEFTAGDQRDIIRSQCWYFSRSQSFVWYWELVSIDNARITVKVHYCGESPPPKPLPILQGKDLGDRLRGLENYLRKEIGEPLEIYCEQEDDANKPRSPERRQKIKEWLRNRKQMKKQAKEVGDHLVT